jgi:GNAT superfamily N-acetyltransferase
VIRPGDIADLAEIELVRTSVRENHLSIEQLKDRGITKESIARQMRKGELGCWVVVVNGKVIGFSMAERDTANIWALFVLPEHEGQGHGTPLLEACESWLSSLGHKEAHLDTGKITRAAEFYRRKGWVEGEYPGRPEEALFRKKL